MALAAMYVGFADTNGLGGYSASMLPFNWNVHRNLSIYSGASNYSLILGPNSIFRTTPQQPYPDNAFLVALRFIATAGISVQVHHGALMVFDSPNANAGLITLTAVQGSLFLFPELAATPNGIGLGTGAGAFEEALGYKGNYTHRLSATTPTTLILGSTAAVCTRSYVP